MRGTSHPLSVQRRMVIDLLYFATGIPTVPVQKRMSLGPLIGGTGRKPRTAALDGDLHQGIWVVAEEFPELRRVYIKLTLAAIVRVPDQQGQHPPRARLQRRVRRLAGFNQRPRASIACATSDTWIGYASTTPVEEIKDFRRWTQFARLPTFVRRAFWWLGLNWGRQRGNYFGTFGVSVYSALKAESLHPLSPATTVLNYGVMTEDGVLDVRIIYDHRVMNGATVARVLGRLEEILNTVMIEEVQSLEKST